VEPRKEEEEEEEGEGEGEVKIILVEVKVSLFFFFTKHHAMRAHWGSGSIAPDIDLGTRWK
jgi:hypothetical protein